MKQTFPTEETRGGNSNGPRSQKEAEEVIRFENVGKVYRIYHRPYHRLLEILRNRKYHQSFVALQNIDLSVGKGESVALIGENGAGKSTFLKIATGISMPSEGTVHRSGRIGALLELGFGFHPEFSGRDNVYLNAALLGFSRSEIDKHYKAIVDFSELGPFMDQAVKTYSTGMYVRLAFSIAITIDPEILIIDEALAVGDVRFQKKCLERIRSLRERNKTILFCSHSMYQVRQLCERAVWLKNGRIEKEGAAYDVVSAYLEYMDCREEAGLPPAPDKKRESGSEAPATSRSFDDAKASPPPRLLGVEFFDGGEEPGTCFQCGQPFRVRILGRGNGYNGPCGILFSITLDRWQVFAASSLSKGKTFFIGEDDFTVEVEFPSLPLLSGNYFFNTYLTDEEGLCIHDAREQIDRFRVDETEIEAGVVHLDHRWLTP
jgi:lipopolysaccharide transport system ATP-binding protein